MVATLSQPHISRLEIPRRRIPPARAETRTAGRGRGSGGPGYSIGNERRFDVWGQLRNGSGGPSQKYCANLGHSEDYVSGLTYMRARYYEPKTGRFISEDPSRDGWNWYGYCAGDPVNCVDESGKEAGEQLLISLLFTFVCMFTGLQFKNAMDGHNSFERIPRDLFKAAMNAFVYDLCKEAPKSLWATLKESYKLSEKVEKSDIGEVIVLVTTAMVYTIMIAAAIYAIDKGIDDYFTQIEAGR